MLQFDKVYVDKLNNIYSSLHIVLETTLDMAMSYKLNNIDPENGSTIVKNNALISRKLKTGHFNNFIAKFASTIKININ